MNHFKSLLHPVPASACNCGHSCIESKKEQEKGQADEEERHKTEKEMDYDNLTTFAEVL